MFGLGTLINVAAIIAGGTIGLIFGSRLNDRNKQALISSCGLCTLFIGIAGCLEQMFSFNGTKFVSSGTLVVILSYAFGTLLGSILDLEGKIESFGKFLKMKAGGKNDNNFVVAFVISSLTVCIGAMAVVGAIRDGVNQDISILVAKSILDFVIIMILASSLGKGCLFSAIPVALFQGTITLLAVFLESLLTPLAVHNISMTGSMMIFCVGVNLIFGQKFAVANMLPTLLFAVAFAYIPVFN